MEPNKKRKVNIHDMIGVKAPVKTQRKITTEQKNVIKTNEIKISDIKLVPKKIKAKGVKRNVYFDHESWKIIEKVQELKGYNSISETIQNMIKAHKKE